MALLGMSECKAVGWRGMAEALLPALAAANAPALDGTALLSFAFHADHCSIPGACAGAEIFITSYISDFRLGFCDSSPPNSFYFLGCIRLPHPRNPTLRMKC